MCFSLGSTRTFQTMTLNHDRKKDFILKSGTGVFFNRRWNEAHMHAVPQSLRSIAGEEVACGPRISICFFLHRSNKMRPALYRSLSLAGKFSFQANKLRNQQMQQFET